MPAVANSVKDGQPSLAARVESLGRDLDEIACSGATSILAVNIEQQSDRRLVARCYRLVPDSAQHLGKSGAHHRGATWPNAGDALQPAVVCGCLQPFERIDMEGFRDAVRQRRTDARNRTKQLFGVGGAPQVFEKAPAPRHQHLRDCARDRDTDAGDGFKCLSATPFGDEGEIVGQRQNGLRRPAIGRDAKWIG